MKSAQWTVHIAHAKLIIIYNMFLACLVGKNTGRCEFTNNARRWGWRKFISLEDFKDSSNGYLMKNKCCIEAEVAIVGSSKME